MLNHYTEIIPTRYGNMVALKCDQHISAALAMYGESTRDEVAMCLTLVRPGDVVLDVGANIGTFTVPLALAVGRKGQVFAFEPQRIVYQCLCANLAINSLSDYVDPIRAGVGAADGTANIPAINPFLKNNNVGGVRLNQPGDHSEQVPVITIDSLGLQSLRLIKIDVEGMEHEVLAGAAETVKRCQPAIFAECLPGDEKNAAGLKAFFAAHNYKAWSTVVRLFSPQNVRLCPDDVFGEQYDHNIVALPANATPPDWVKQATPFA